MAKNSGQGKFLPSGIEGVFREEIRFESKFKSLEAMAPAFIAAAEAIRTAISDGTPVFVRHHADADGYAGGVALEKAVFPIVKQLRFADSWRYFDRAPSKAPFYEYSDVLRDIITSRKNRERFGSKLPLVVLVDFGSTGEDLLALRRAKIHGMNIIVIDHHNPGKITSGKAEIDKYTEAHVNPYLFGSDKNITAGMLAYEVARTIDAGFYSPVIPAVAGISDKARGEILDGYVAESGESLEFLKKLAACVDFEAHYLGYGNDAGLIDELLSLNDFSRATVELLYAEIEMRIKAQNLLLKEYSKPEELQNGFVLGWFDDERSTERGEFPAMGKTCGLFMDWLTEKYKSVPLVAVAYGSDIASLRANSLAEKRGFDFNRMVRDIAENVPGAGVEGGGHEVAGAIRFVPIAREKVFAGMRHFISKMM